MIRLILVVVLAFTSSLISSQDENRTKYIQTEEMKEFNLPFSQAVIHGDIIYLSGQLGNKGMNLVNGGIGPETYQAMLNIKKILEENGSSLDHVIKCTCMLADIKEWPEMNKEYVKFFPNHKPARSAFAGTGLALGGRIEIECMASLKKLQP